jgi:hypothetical protein
MRFVDDEHDLLATLSALGRQQLLGLGDQRGVMKPWGTAQRGDDQPVDPAQPDAGGAEVDDRVPGRVQAGDRRPSGDGLADAVVGRPRRVVSELLFGRKETAGSS